MQHDARDLCLVKCNLRVPGRGPISLMITQLLITNTATHPAGQIIIAIIVGRRKKDGSYNGGQKL